jgi:hypothetical protein
MKAHLGQHLRPEEAGSHKVAQEVAAEVVACTETAADRSQKDRGTEEHAPTPGDKSFVCTKSSKEANPGNMEHAIEQRSEEVCHFVLGVHRTQDLIERNEGHEESLEKLHGLERGRQMHTPFHTLGVDTTGAKEKLEDIEDSTVHGHREFRLAGRGNEFHDIGIFGMLDEDPDRLQQITHNDQERKTTHNGRSLHTL